MLALKSILLMIVAFGTSAPEAAISISAAKGEMGMLDTMNRMDESS